MPPAVSRGEAERERESRYAESYRFVAILAQLPVRGEMGCHPRRIITPRALCRPTAPTAARVFSTSVYIYFAAPAKCRRRTGSVMAALGKRGAT